MTDPIDHLKRYGQDLADSVPPGRSHVVVARAMARTNRPRPRRMMPRVATASVGVLLFANIATAAIADSAVPGDSLYPLDRAYEWVLDRVGLDADRTEERLDEATTLVARDELIAAIELVDETLGDEAVTDVSADLAAAGLAHEELKLRVEALVFGARQISVAAKTGDQDAKRDAQALVRTLAHDVADAAGNPDRPADPPAQPTPGGTNPNKPDDPGRPDDPGNQGNSGNPGNPGDQGPPNDPGNQGKSGNPGDQGPPDDPGNQGNSGNQGNPGDKGNSGK